MSEAIMLSSAEAREVLNAKIQAATAAIEYTTDDVSHGTTDSGVKLYHATMRPCQVVAIEADNPQRSGYDHFKTDGETKALVQSVRNRELLTEYRPTYHLYNPARHKAAVEASLVETENYLKKEIDTAKDATDKDRLTYSLEQFLFDHKKDGSWIMPDAICVGGNSRWFAAILANGYRIADGLSPILSIPVNLIKYTLSVPEFLAIQLDENRLSAQTQTPVDNMGRARAMRWMLRAMANSGLPLPLSRDAYGKILCGIASGVQADKNYNNWVDGSRLMVMLDHFYPNRKIFSRLASSTPVDGLSPLLYTVAFNSKAETWKIILAQLLPNDNNTKNNLRKKAAAAAFKASAITPPWCQCGTTDWHARMAIARQHMPLMPYLYDLGLEIEQCIPPEADIEGILSAAKPPSPKTLSQQIDTYRETALTVQKGETTLTPTQVLLRETLNTLQTNGLDGVVKLATTAAPLVDIAAKIAAVPEAQFTAEQWLQLILAIPQSDHAKVQAYLRGKAAAVNP